MSNVISISYGFTESQFSRSYFERQCHEYMKLGLQGVTIVASSGDDGAGSSDRQFAPSFPCTCPHASIHSFVLSISFCSYTHFQ